MPMAMTAITEKESAITRIADGLLRLDEMASSTSSADEYLAFLSALVQIDATSEKEGDSFDNITPSEKMSLDISAFSPEMTSGAAYSNVPAGAFPEMNASESDNPKSMIFTFSPRLVIMMFSGLRSL